MLLACDCCGICDEWYRVDETIADRNSSKNCRQDKVHTCSPTVTRHTCELPTPDTVTHVI